jgi:hypothetical protein
MCKGWDICETATVGIATATIEISAAALAVSTTAAAVIEVEGILKLLLPLVTSNTNYS